MAKSFKIVTILRVDHDGTETGSIVCGHVDFADVAPAWPVNRMADMWDMQRMGMTASQHARTGLPMISGHYGMVMFPMWARTTHG